MPSCTNNRLTGRQPCHLRTIGCFLIAPELHLIDYEKAQKMGVGENIAVIISWYCWHGVMHWSHKVKIWLGNHCIAVVLHFHDNFVFMCL